MRDFRRVEAMRNWPPSGQRSRDSSLRHRLGKGPNHRNDPSHNDPDDTSEEHFVHAHRSREQTILARLMLQAGSDYEGCAYRSLTPHRRNPNNIGRQQYRDGHGKWQKEHIRSTDPNEDEPDDATCQRVDDA